MLELCLHYSVERKYLLDSRAAIIRPQLLVQCSPRSMSKAAASVRLSQTPASRSVQAYLVVVTFDQMKMLLNVLQWILLMTQCGPLTFRGLPLKLQCFVFSEHSQ